MWPSITGASWCDACKCSCDPQSYSTCSQGGSLSGQHTSFWLIVSALSRQTPSGSDWEQHTLPDVVLQSAAITQSQGGVSNTVSWSPRCMLKAIRAPQKGQADAAPCSGSSRMTGSNRYRRTGVETRGAALTFRACTASLVGKVVLTWGPCGAGQAVVKLCSWHAPIPRCSDIVH